VVVDFTQGSGSTGEAALKLGCKYIGSDIDQEVEDECLERLNHYEEWQQKPPCFWLEEWRKEINWAIFTKVKTPQDVAEVTEEQEGIFGFFQFGLGVIQTEKYFFF